MAFVKALNLQGLFIALPLVAMVLALGWWYARSQRKRRSRPGQSLRYRVPTLTAASCRGLLSHPAPEDIFSYTLEGAPSGGWYLTFTLHNPTGQPLSTLFLLQFEAEAPAILSLRFVREAFGMTEPVISEALLDQFFAEKMGAQRLPEGDS